MSAVRVARGVTGRDKIVKMTGHYHGHVDALLVQAGSAATTLGHAQQPGRDRGRDAGHDPLPVQRRLGRRRRFSTSYPGQVAAVLLEPVAGNMGLVPPRPGYLETLRELTEKHGALLVFDEVMTGFRARLRRRPGAVRGHARPDGAGQDHRRRPARRGLRGLGRGSWTTSRRPGRSTRRARSRATRWRWPPGWRRSRLLRDEPPYERLEALSARLAEGLERAATDARVPHVVQRVGQHAHPLLPRRPGPQLRGRQAERHRRSSPGSSGRCSPAASTCRAASSRPPSSPPPTPRPTSTTPSQAAREAARGDRPTRSRSRGGETCSPLSDGRVDDPRPRAASSCGSEAAWRSRGSRCRRSRAAALRRQRTASSPRGRPLVHPRLPARRAAPPGHVGPQARGARRDPRALPADRHERSRAPRSANICRASPGWPTSTRSCGRSATTTIITPR